MKFLTLTALAGGALAQSGAWGQCGGNGWTGPTTCVAGYTCTFSNPWYSQCLPGTGPPPVTTTSTSTTQTTLRTTTTTSTSTRTTNNPGPTSLPGEFMWYGTNVAGAEFGENTLPGQWGKHFTFPDPNAINTLRRDGYNTFRVQFKMERLSQQSLTGSFDQAYLTNLTNSINHITNSGAYAVLDPHNYGRYFGNVITDVAAFRTWWRNVATLFASNQRVIFDTNNEYHTMDQGLVLNLNQAAIDGIRAAGATQWIFAEGNQWSGAWSWPDVNDNMKNLQDPLDKHGLTLILTILQLHQYLDSDSSGTSPNCVSGTIGRERLVAATNWMRANGKLAILGEFAGGANQNCRTAVQGMMDYLEANDDVWKGWLWWAAGPWWADYMYSFEPPSGTGYQYYNSLLKQYIP